MVLAICMQLKRRVQKVEDIDVNGLVLTECHCHGLYPMLKFRPPSRMKVIFAIFGSSNRLLSD